jgi:hypothetical protein
MGSVIQWELWPVGLSLAGGRGCRRLSDCWNITSSPARRRVDGLREEADRIQAELAAAEQESQEWAIAGRRFDTVLARHDSTAEAETTADPRDADAQPELQDAVKPRSQVPVWMVGVMDQG